MATVKLYAVKDNKASAYLEPFTCANDAVASRAFAQRCNDSNTVFYKFPQDFDLYEIGTYDQESSNIIQRDEHPRMTISGTTAKQMLPSGE